MWYRFSYATGTHYILQWVFLFLIFTFLSFRNRGKTVRTYRLTIWLSVLLFYLFYYYSLEHTYKNSSSKNMPLHSNGNNKIDYRIYLYCVLLFKDEELPHKEFLSKRRNNCLQNVSQSTSPDNHSTSKLTDFFVFTQYFWKWHIFDTRFSKNVKSLRNLDYSKTKKKEKCYETSVIYIRCTWVPFFMVCCVCHFLKSIYYYKMSKLSNDWFSSVLPIVLPYI